MRYNKMLKIFLQAPRRRLAPPAAPPAAGSGAGGAGGIELPDWRHRPAGAKGAGPSRSGAQLLRIASGAEACTATKPPGQPIGFNLTVLAALALRRRPG